MDVGETVKKDSFVRNNNYKSLVVDVAGKEKNFYKLIVTAKNLKKWGTHFEFCKNLSA